MCACSVAQSYLTVTPWTAACQDPLPMGFFQARRLEWAAISSSRGSSLPRDQTHISCVSRFGRRILYHYKRALRYMTLYIYIYILYQISSRKGGALKSGIKFVKNDN